MIYAIFELKFLVYKILLKIYVHCLCLCCFVDEKYSKYEEAVSKTMIMLNFTLEYTQKKYIGGYRVTKISTYAVLRLRTHPIKI